MMPTLHADRGKSNYVSERGIYTILAQQSARMQWVMARPKQHKELEIPPE